MRKRKSMGPEYRAFVCSTYEDLREHRGFVIDSLRRAGFDVEAMEVWTPNPGEPKTVARDRVAACDLCVVLLAHRRGYVPRGDLESITQQEYGCAVSKRIDVLVFMLDDDAPWPPRFVETHTDPEVERWRRELREKHVVGFFGLEPRSIEIGPAIARWIRDRRGMEPAHVPAPPPSEDFAAQVGTWLGKLNYRFCSRREIDRGLQWVMDHPAKQGSTVVRCVEGEAEIAQIEGLRQAVREEGALQGWLIVPLRISPSVRDELRKDEPGNISCYTFDELLDQHADFSKYFEWLEREITSRGIDKHYVTLACTKEEFDANGNKTGLAQYDEPSGGLGRYIDLWLQDRSKEHVSILGEFGTGKTWFALYYAWKALQRYREAVRNGVERPRLPLYIPLREYAKAVNVESLISDFFFRKHEIPLPGYSAFEELNRMGKLLLIFDGFDEMAARVDWEAIIENFWQLARVVVEGSKAILTCRKEHFTDAAEGRKLLRAELRDATARLTGQPPQFEVVEVKMFNKSQICQVLRNHGASDETIERILANEDLRDLARRPLLIEFILDALPGLQESVSLGISHVFRMALRQKLTRDIPEERTFTSLADKLYFFCEISWEMLREGRDVLHYEDFPDRVRDLFGERVRRQKELDHWRFDLARQGLLIRNAKGEYSPAHRSLIEFFAAYKLVAELGALAPEFVELSQQREPEVDPQLEPREYTWSEYFKREVIEGEGMKRIAPLARFVGEKIYEKDKSRSPVRLSKLTPNALVFAAGMVSREPAILQELCKLAWERTGTLARNAIELLRYLRDERAPIVASTLVKNCEGGFVPSGVAFVLGELRVSSEEVCHALQRTVEGFRDGGGVRPPAWWESAFALQKLGKIGINPERDEKAAVQYLAQHRPPGCSLEKAKDRFRGALRAATPREACMNQCDIITIAAHRDEIDASFLRQMISLTDFASDELGLRVYHVVWLCGYLHAEEAVPHLVLATNHPHSTVRNIAAEALSRIRVARPDVIAAMEKTLKDKYYRARFHAAWALWDLRSVNSIDKLSTAINNEGVPSVREAMERVRQLLEQFRRV